MDTPNTEFEASPTETYDPFPQPNTIPDGWDVSQILSPSPTDFAESEADGDD